jgi:hypothetical protein
VSVAAVRSPPRTNLSAAALGLVLAAILVVPLDGPIWLVKIVPTQDGPVHLAQADLIAQSGWGGTLPEPVSAFYQWNPRIEPNSAVYLLLAGLIYATGNALLANSIFLTLYGLIWIAAAFFAARAETSRPLLPALLLLPIAFGVFIHWGFYNYALGIPLFLLFAAFWRSLAARRDVFASIGIGSFLLLLCLTHLASVVAACLLLAADGIARASKTLKCDGARAAFQGLVRDGIWAFAVATPALLLILGFLVAYQDIPPAGPGIDGGYLQIVRRIAAATYLFTFTRWEVVALSPLLIVVVIAAATSFRRMDKGDLLWPVFLVLIVFVSLLNLKTGAAFLSERLAPFSGIAVILTIASRQPAPAVVRAMSLAAILGLTGQSFVRVLAYRNWSPLLEQVFAAARSHPGETFANADLLPQRASTMFGWRVRPMLHANQTAAVAAHGAGLSSPLPSTRYFGYFPLQYVPAHDFMRATPDWVDEPDPRSATAFQRANQGAPQRLIVTAIDQSGSELASRLGYNDCRESLVAERRLLVCGHTVQDAR